MAQSPVFKVFRNGEYVASCKYPEDAAAICGMGGDCCVKYGHKGPVIYHHKNDNEIAGNSWDDAADLMVARVDNYLFGHLNNEST